MVPALKFMAEVWARGESILGPVFSGIFQKI